MNKASVLALILILILLPLGAAIIDAPIADEFDQVIINSQDYKDIYAGLLFGRLVDKPADFLLAPDTAQDFVVSLDIDQRRVLLLEPSSGKQYAGLAKLLEGRGFIATSLPRSGDIQLQLAKELPLTHVIITDERYPYNAVSLAPYALQRDAFVLFADAANVDEVLALISEKDADVTTYGIIDARVQEALAPYNHTIIDKGGKFDDNLYVVEEFLKKDPVKQVIVTNGDFIEQGLIDGAYPVLFTGRTNTPVQVEEFLAGSDITHGVIVGNYLATSVKQLKDRLQNVHGKEIIFILRFGRSPRVQDQLFNEPTALEYFALPIIEPGLNITSAAYNHLTGQLEVTYLNPSPITTFFLASLELKSPQESVTLGDQDAQTLTAGQQKTLLYDAKVTPEGLTLAASVIYGAYPSSLEYSLQQTLEDVPIITVADESSIAIKRILYDKADKAFYITLENDGPIDAYANVELIDVIIDGVPATVGTARTFLIGAGEEEDVYVRAKLSDLDLRENERVHVKATYGKRQGVLFKEAEATLPLSVRLVKPVYAVAGAALLAVLIIVLLILFTRKRRWVCDRCGHRHEGRGRPGRHSCGGRFKKA